MKPQTFFAIILAGIMSFFVVSCQSGQTTATEATSDSETTTEATVIYENPAVPDWSHNMNIYEVNVRQYTPEGTLNAFAEHLPRLKEMGVDILWFMPIFPISETKRKGPLGSYYAVSDFKEVNPAFGTKEDFKAMMDKIRELDMRIILDWVPNHTGWDHVWISAHPDYYTQDEDGNIIDPINPETGESWGWTDVADLNYDNPEMRKEMISDMKYWLTDLGIDGFRVDVAHNVPMDFWEQAVPELRAANEELFMLAEAEIAELNNKELYAMGYGWSFHHTLNHVASGEEPATAIAEWFEEEHPKWEKGYLMHFITNHDENSWNGTVAERMGENADAMAVLAFTIDGMPLIYSGQEAAMSKRLKFFEKDPIEWGDFSKKDFYKKLLTLKHDNQALWNGIAGGETHFISTENEDKVIAYYREKGDDKVLVMVNVGEQAVELSLADAATAGEYTDAFSGEKVRLNAETTLTLAAHGYQVLVK